MKFKDKQELVQLLNLYQADLLSQADKNDKERKKHEYSWECNLRHGLKAQYEHARCIVNKLSVEIGKEIKTYW